MSESAIIYFALFLLFLLLIVFIKLYPDSRKDLKKNGLLYYKLNLKDKKITTISSVIFHNDILVLENMGYKLIFLPDIEAFTNQKKRLPNNSFLITSNESYSQILQNALPALIAEKISLIIFLPVLVADNSIKYQDKEMQQLNEFVFSSEFKNIFSYTQPTQYPSTTS